MTPSRSMIALSCASGNCRSPGHKRPAVLMARQDGARKDLERLPDRRVGGMRQVQHHACGIHLAQERFGRGEESPGGAGARPVGVGAHVVVREADDAQTGFIPLADLSGRKDRIGALHPDDQSDRQVIVGLCLFPRLDMRLQAASRREQTDLTFGFERSVIGEVTVRSRVGQMSARVAPKRTPRSPDPSAQLYEGSRDPAATHLRERGHERSVC